MKHERAVRLRAGIFALLSLSTRAFAQEPSDASAPVEPTAPVPTTPAPTASPPTEASETELDDPSLLEGAGIDEVVVTVTRSSARQMQQSAEAVNVIDTRKAQQQTADLGEVLARTQGVAIRRDGGLGSEARFSLNGLYDDQIRFFLDGVPLELAGYPFGIVNVPVNLVDRIDIYRGVVPVRFGADALGGAVNLVSDQSYENHLGASYQIGSFGTQRATLDGRYRQDPSGFVVGGSAFFDTSQNDYWVDVEIPDAVGRLAPARVPRFHDAYRAYGGILELGVVDQPWARRLLVQGFASTYDKELQHNVVMTVPYGEVTYGETVYGGTARYDVALSDSFELELVASYAHRIIDFVDKGQWVYDWNGQRVRERRVAGEIDSDPTDQKVWQDSVFARTTAIWTLMPEHILRLSLSPAFAKRSGDERIQASPTARDPLSAKRELFTFVSGLEYETNLLNDRLSNIMFVKNYVYRTSTEEDLPGGIFRARDTNTHRLGAGDSLRYRVTPWLYAKASYEYATRLPRPDEVFGDGVLILANLELQTEVSHNANIGPRIELREDALGTVTLDINWFLRDSDRLIVLLGNDRFSTYQNIYAARALGLENGLSWESPERYLSLDGTLTWQSVRNASSSGAFASFEGDRIPNRPYLFASWGARLRFANLPGPDDVLEPFYSGRYVHEFYRGWESQGRPEFKQVIDAQVTHGAGLSWTIDRYFLRGTATFEVDNLSGAKAFDNFGAERPGRSYSLKLTGDLR